MTVHPHRQAVWGHIWKRTVEKRQINATNATMPLLRQAIWGNIWKYIVEKTKQMQPMWLCPISSRSFEGTFENAQSLKMQITYCLWEFSYSSISCQKLPFVAKSCQKLTNVANCCCQKILFLIGYYLLRANDQGKMSRGQNVFAQNFTQDKMLQDRMSPNHSISLKD